MIKKITNNKTIITGKGRRRKYVFTYEILPPGSLRRSPAPKESAKERWEEIKSICIKIIEDNLT